MNKALKVVTYIATLGIGLGIGAGIGASGNHVNTRTITVSGPTVTQTIPGQTITVTASPPTPVSGQIIGKWSGTGNQNTGSFQAPGNGNYVISWQYSGNNDPSIGGGTNFAISATDSNADAIGLPNDIASSGHGSTEVTNASGTESFNVQATGSWSITVKAAS